MNDCLMVKTPDGSWCDWHQDNPAGAFYRERVWAVEVRSCCCWILSIERRQKLLDDHGPEIAAALAEAQRRR